MPGSRIPIVEEAAIAAEKPDYVVILPWNLQDEIVTAARLRARLGREVRDGHSEAANRDERSRSNTPRPSITELEVRYATDAASNGWGERCYEYIGRFEAAFKAHLGVQARDRHVSLHRRAAHGHWRRSGSGRATRSSSPTPTGSHPSRRSFISAPSRCFVDILRRQLVHRSRHASKRRSRRAPRPSSPCISTATSAT